QAALLQLELRADDDDRTAGVVDALAEQVLTKPALLALEHVGQRLQRPVAGPGDRTTAAAVVEQGVDGLLQHALLVVDDDLGRAQIEEPLQPVVPVDHAPVQVVEVGGREATAVQLHHRAQVGRYDRHGAQHHAHRGVDPAAILRHPVERGDHLQPLDRLGLALALGAGDDLLERDLLEVEVETLDEVLHGLCAPAAREVLLVALDELAPHLLVVDELLRRQAADGVPDGLVELDLLSGAVAQLLEVLVARLLGALDVGLAGVAAGGGLLVLADLGLVLFVALPETELQGPLDVAGLGADVLLELGQVLLALVLVDPGDQAGGEVDDLLEALRRDVEQVAEAAGDALEIPDVGDGRGELDVAHALAPHLRARDLDAAALTDDALEPDALVLAAIALPVLRRTEDLLAEESVLLGLERAVVDRLRLLHLAVRPHADLLRGGERDGELGGVVDVEHRAHVCPTSSFVLPRSSWFVVVAVVKAVRTPARVGARPLRRCRARVGTGRYRATRWCGRR